MLRALLIAPFPPPTTGHSLAAQTLLEAWRARHEADVVDLSKPGFTHGVDSAGRLVQMLRILRAVRRKRRAADVLYLTIAESVAGNLKDLVIYLLCYPRLSRMVVHLHGGSIGRLLFDRFPLLARVNAFFLRRLGAVIVLGETHRAIFAGVVRPDRLRVVANSAADPLFRDEGEIRARFARGGPLRIVFLSNLITGKGYEALFDAYLSLPLAERARVHLDYAGAFESDAERERFLGRLAGVPGVTYHGSVDGAAKAQLLGASHVFCLPTSLLEGQPISILEAYASGCAVIATDRGGIRDVLVDGRNGFLLTDPTPERIRAAMQTALADRDTLVGIGLANMRLARERYTRAAYGAAMLDVLERVAGTPASGSVSLPRHRPS